MKRTVCVIWLALAILTQPLMLPSAQAADTDDDGLLDLLDVPGFNPSASGMAGFNARGIEDFDGANLLTKLTALDLHYNQITSIEPGAFQGLTNLYLLYLSGNQITSIESGDWTLQEVALAERFELLPEKEGGGVVAIAKS